MKTKVHMRDQMVNKIEDIMLHDQLQHLLSNLTRILPMVLWYRLCHFNLRTVR